MPLKQKTIGTHPAFPSSETTTHAGLTKREFFAAVALAGALAGHYAGNTMEDDIAIAIVTADALIVALNK